jgi:hypothetical protein
MELAVDAVYSHGLDNDDRADNRLNFSADIDHSPGQWASTIAANISRRTVDPGGELITNSLFDSDNAREFRSLSIGTDFQSILGRDLRFNTAAEVDYAEFQGGEGTQGAAVELGLNNFPSLDPLTWRIGLTQQNVDGDQSDSEIQTAAVGVIYQVSRRVSWFMNAEKPDSGIDEFDETATNLGIIWQPSASTRLQIGAGERGENESYLLNATSTHRRYSISANYTEQVTTTRSLLLEGSTNSSGQTVIQPTLQLIPVLVKEGNLSFDLTGRRSTFTISLFDRKILAEQMAADEELIGVEFEFSRALSAVSTLRISTSRQEIETSTENELEDSRVSYEKQLSRHADLSAGLRKTRQSSDLAENRYNQSSINLNLNIIF